MITSINQLIAKLSDSNEVSDGYHTFGELYAHRCQLWIKLCAYEMACGRKPVWRSRLHSDGTSFPGWFILGIGVFPGEQITYHVPNSEWDFCLFATEWKKAPEFDGHTPQDVLKRIKEL
jgi:hypothetical protein